MGKMENKITAYVLIALFQLSNAYWFLPKKQQNLTLSGIWADEATERRIISECDCGSDISILKKGIPSWNVYIHVKKHFRDNDTVCTGTIITSNLIATSHHCVQYYSDHINIFDAWHVKNFQTSVVAKEDIVVSTSRNKSEGVTFEIVDIIYNKDYIMKKQFKKESNSDLLLIEVDEDFTSDYSNYRPICIPYNVDKNHSSIFKIGQVGYYYGGLQRGSQGDEANINICENKNSSRYNHILVHEGNIKKAISTDDSQKESGGRRIKRESDHENSQEVNKEMIHETGKLSLQLELKGNLRAPETPGGPLIIKEKETAYMIGIADNLASESSPTFTNILYLTKYIEHKAKLSRSTWCRQPEIEEDIQERRSKGRWGTPTKFESWPCRKESLDCVCGIDNNIQPTKGRIVGGEKAVPYEFGWMVFLQIKLSWSTSACGATIINDKMILTAAHCVNDQRDNPSTIFLTLNAHRKDGDPKGIELGVEQVIIHPDYKRGVYKGDYDYDVGLLVLKDRLQFAPIDKPGLRPICLPYKDEQLNVVGKSATISGWGKTHPDKDDDDVELKKIVVPIQPLSFCSDVHSFANDLFVCATTGDRWQAADKGDSGGPVKIKQGRQWTEIGICSWQASSGNCDRNEWWCNNPIKKVNMFADIRHPDQLAFVDLHADKVGANWCKSRIE